MTLDEGDASLIAAGVADDVCCTLRSGFAMDVDIADDAAGEIEKAIIRILKKAARLQRKLEKEQSQ